MLSNRLFVLLCLCVYCLSLCLLFGYYILCVLFVPIIFVFVCIVCSLLCVCVCEETSYSSFFICKNGLFKMQTEISSGIPLTIKTERISTLKLHSNFCKLFIAQFSLIHTIEYEHIIIYPKNSVITLTRNCSYTILF